MYLEINNIILIRWYSVELPMKVYFSKFKWILAGLELENILEFMGEWIDQNSKLYFFFYYITSV